MEHLNDLVTTELLVATADAICGVFESCLGEAARAGDPFAAKANVPPPFEIAAAATCSGTGIIGSLILAFPTQTYLGIAAQLTGQSASELTDSPPDGAPELLNMAMGRAAASLNEHGCKISWEIPTVTQGKRAHELWRLSPPAVVMPFTCASGPFYLAVSATDRPNLTQVL